MSGVHLSQEAISGRLDRLKADMPQLYQTFVQVARGTRVQMTCMSVMPHKDAEFDTYAQTGLSGKCLTIPFSPNELNLLKEYGLVCGDGKVIPLATQMLGTIYRDLRVA
jgi:hypothetical protein